jgi:hypothetical protein
MGHDVRALADLDVAGKVVTATILAGGLLSGRLIAVEYYALAALAATLTGVFVTALAFAAEHFLTPPLERIFDAVPALGEFGTATRACHPCGARSCPTTAASRCRCRSAPRSPASSGVNRNGRRRRMRRMKSRCLRSRRAKRASLCASRRRHPPSTGRSPNVCSVDLSLDGNRSRPIATRKIY